LKYLKLLKGKHLQPVIVSLFGINGRDIGSVFEVGLLLGVAQSRIQQRPIPGTCTPLEGRINMDSNPNRRPVERWCLLGGTLVGMLLIGGSIAWVRIEDGIGVALAAITDFHWGGGSAVTGSLRGLLRLGFSSK